MSELDLFIEWLKTKDSAFLDTTDVPKVISWLEELKVLREKAKSDKWYQQGRADGINELAKTLFNVNWEMVSLVNIPPFIMHMAEEVKEKNNDR